MHNLADAPQHQQLLAALKDQLLGELKRTGDPRALGDDRFEKPLFTDP